jgi:hypothetical protein
MLARRPLQGVTAFKRVGAINRHLPSVALLGADDEDSPIPRPARKHVLDLGDHVPLQILMADIVHFDDYRHSQSVRFSYAAESMM